MPTASSSSAPALHACQVCFVVDVVEDAARDAAARFGWGPFQEFTARVPDARYRGWRGTKVLNVALGMAGGVQVELIHVCEGRDGIEAYQARYGTGFQHLGIVCRSREAGVTGLEAAGAVVDDSNEYAGTRFAFLDAATGPSMLELLEPGAHDGSGGAPGLDGRSDEAAPGALALDRATIVTGDMEEALRFYSAAFGWERARADLQTLRHGGRETRMKRFLGPAGALELELVEPERDGDDPYSAHSRRGSHGRVHAGGIGSRALPGTASGGAEYEWVEANEKFALVDWLGGRNALQVRCPAA